MFSNRVRRMSILEIVARIGAVEGFVAERKVGDDVAFDRRFQQRPLEPRRVTQMAARDLPSPSSRAKRKCRRGNLRPSPRPSQFSRRRSELRLRSTRLASRCKIWSLSLSSVRPHGCDPDACIDITRIEHRHLEVERGHRADNRARRAHRRRGRSRVRHSRLRRMARQLGAENAGRRRCDPAAKRCCRKGQQGAEKSSGPRPAGRETARCGGTQICSSPPLARRGRIIRR